MQFSWIFLVLATRIAATFCYEDYFVRLEAQIIRLENPQGLTSAGTPCGGLFSSRQCNTVVAAQIDTESSNRIHDKFSRTLNTPFNIISTTQDDNDPHVGKIVTKDICGKSLEKALVRVRAYETGISGDNRINDFICETVLHSHHVHSAWSPVQLCQPEFQIDKMRLYFRYRVTRLRENQCRDKASHYQ